ncbi:MAG: helix-turn-helix domain-containing protein [Patescibacteria group bacterium]
MPPIVGKALKEIGLADKEAAALLVLLEHGPMLASAIAKESKLNRTTVYGLLKELSGKALVSQIKKDGADRWQSIPAESLPQYIERRREQLADNKKAVEEALPQIKLLRAKGKSLPKVQFFEGAEGVQQAYEDTLINNQSKTLHDITGVDAIYQNIDPKFVDYYLNKRKALGIKATYIAPKTEGGLRAAQEDTKLLREVRFIPAQYTFDSEIAIYDNKVGIFSYAKENPVALIIEDETIAHTMKQIFNYIESTAEKS